MSLLVSKYANSKGCDSLSRLIEFMAKLLGLTLSIKEDGFELVVIDASGHQFNIVVNSQRFGVWSKDSQAYLWRVEF